MLLRWEDLYSAESVEGVSVEVANASAVSFDEPRSVPRKTDPWADRAFTLQLLLRLPHPEYSVFSIDQAVLSGLDIVQLINQVASTDSQTKTLLFTINKVFEEDVFIDVLEQITALFRGGREELFEDGVESGFSRRLVELIITHGSSAMREVSNIILNGKANDEVSSEALRWLGHIDHTASYQYRLSLLKRALRSPSARVRDGALLGLSYLDDPDALDDLQLAIQKENVKELRKDMEQVLGQLEATLNALSA